MNKKIKLSKLNKKGAGMVTVIIAIALVTILCSIVLEISYLNYKMKQTNLKSKDNFYSAETALDEISMGLQNEVISPAISEAYLTVMEEYALYDTTEKKNERMQQVYYERIWAKIGVAGGFDKYDPAYLLSFVTQQWDDTTSSGVLITGGSCNMATYEGKGVVLEGVEVYYRDTAGYSTTITTDIRLVCPVMQFGNSTTLPDIMQYCVIADTNTVITSVSNTNPVNFKGNVYAGNIDVNAASSAFAVTFDDFSALVSKSNVNVNKGTVTFNGSGNLWTSSIVLDSAMVTINSGANLSNDVNLKGNRSNIHIANRFNGYGCDINDASKSSAILVNGTESTVDFSGAENVTIAGHAFVGTKQNNLGAIGNTTTGAGKNAFTGESIAIKSNQFMYLVPGECIGVPYTEKTVSGVTTRTYGKSMYGANPMTATQYNNINVPGVEAVVTNVVVSKLGHSLAGYISMNGSTPDIEKVFVRSNSGETMVYFYMTFANETSANQYFKDYYSLNKAEVDSYYDVYAKNIIIPNVANMVRLQTAGNILKYNGTTDTVTALDNTVNDASIKLAASSSLYSAQMASLCKRLLTTGADDFISKDADGVFGNIVDVAAFKTFVNAVGAGAPKEVVFPEAPVSGAATASCYAVLVNNEGSTEYVYDSAKDNLYDGKLHLIIATGNVRVSHDFNGLIFTDGTVTVEPGVKLTADPDNVRLALRLKSASDKYVYEYMLDGANIANVGAKVGDTVTSLNLADMVVYENWKKR